MITLQTTDFNKVLDKFRKCAYSERDKGGKFERLIQRYLQANPIHKDLAERLWISTTDNRSSNAIETIRKLIR